MRTVLITGGSRGIGAGCAEAFSENGYFTVICYNRSEDKAKELRDKINGAGSRCEAFCADVTDREQVRRLISLCEYHAGGVDVLINSAGIDFYGTFEQTEPQIWDELIKTDLTGIYNVTYAALPLIKRSDCGRIINVSSVWGTYGASCEVAYSAAKSAVNGFTRALARETGPAGVTVNCIAPGFINTDMNARFGSDDVRDIIERTPIGRAGEPRDIAHTALFLASEQAGFITGQIIGVDGGFI